MAGGDHDGAVEAIALGDGGHEHGGGAGHAEIGDIQALLHHGLADPLTQLGTGQAGIPAHGHTQIRFGGLVLQPQGKSPADIAADLFRQVDVLAFDALKGNAADVAAVLQFAVIHMMILPKGLFLLEL